MAANFFFLSLTILIVLQMNLSFALAQYQEERIINSTVVIIEDYPFIVSIQWLKYHICGGVIISTEYILTSAKCIDTFGIGELKILAGSTLLDGYDSEHAQERGINYKFIHEKYESETWKYDIAILKLSTALTESTTVTPIGFYEGLDRLENLTELTVIGWGALVEGASFYPKDLHAKFMLSYDMENCTEEIQVQEGYFVHPESMFCAQSFDISAGVPAVGGICDGDFGGPVVTTTDETMPEMQLVGLASRSLGCDNDYPNLFTNLQKMRTFINETTGLWGSTERAILSKKVGSTV